MLIYTSTFALVSFYLENCINRYGGGDGGSVGGGSGGGSGGGGDDDGGASDGGGTVGCGGGGGSGDDCNCDNSGDGAVVLIVRYTRWSVNATIL